MQDPVFPSSFTSCLLPFSCSMLTLCCNFALSFANTHCCCYCCTATLALRHVSVPKATSDAGAAAAAASTGITASDNEAVCLGHPFKHRYSARGCTALGAFAGVHWSENDDGSKLIFPARRDRPRPTNSSYTPTGIRCEGGGAIERYEYLMRERNARRRRGQPYRMPTRYDALSSNIYPDFAAFFSIPFTRG
uniref:Putative secreted protein n=1 Tax=Anopheles darlingi TaxID=43151 RepID=A0A2M4DN76_ANODA